MASAWSVKVLPEAKRNLREIRRNLGDEAYYSILADISDLEYDPTPDASSQMRGERDLYRIYTYRALYRIIYRKVVRFHLIQIVAVGPRSTIYSGFDRW
jgi:mRNA-degrading endonuclease RelE of RelBE toxin-antitoxin system